MTPFTALSVAFTVAALVSPQLAWAGPCLPDPLYTHGPDVEDAPIRPIDAHPWAGLYPDEVDQVLSRDPQCVLSPVDGGEGIPASVVVAPRSHEEFPTMRCETGSAFVTTLARFTPEARLQPNTTYRISCEGELLIEQGVFITGEPLAAPPPELVVADVGVEAHCEKRLMRLELEGVDPSFWGEGGFVLAEYEDGATDWDTSPPESGALYFELPEEGDEIVTLTLVNGAGVEGPSLELDVTAIAGPRGIEAGCALGRISHSFWGMGLCVLLLRGRSRRRSS